MLALQPGLFGREQTLVVADELMPLDGLGDHPNQVSRGGSVDADVTVGADFVTQGGHLLFALRAEDDDRFVGAAGPVALDHVQRVELLGLVADQHGVEDFVAQSGQARSHPHRLFQNDPRGAVGGKRLGQPSAGPMPRGDIQHSHAGGKLLPGGRAGRSIRRGHFGKQCDHESLRRGITLPAETCQDENPWGDTVARLPRRVKLGYIVSRRSQGEGGQEEIGRSRGLCFSITEKRCRSVRYAEA